MFPSGPQPSLQSRSTVTGASRTLDASIRRFQEHGDTQALREVMPAYDWIAVSCARRMRRGGEAIEDLEQVAREALIGAATRFDFERGVPFKSFAWVTVMGAIRHHYRNQWQVRVPRSLQELHLKTARAVRELAAAGICEPTVSELATFMNVRQDDVVMALDVKHAYVSASLDHRLSEEWNGASDQVLGDIDRAIESTVDRVIVRDMLDRLPSAQRTALTMTFFEGRTQAEVGVTLGFTQVQVSRLMRSALDVLRERLGDVVEPQPSVPPTS